MKTTFLLMLLVVCFSTHGQCDRDFQQYDHKTKTIMKVSIQVGIDTTWNKTQFVIHEVENIHEANLIAFAISKQFGGTTVRMVTIPDTYSEPLTIEYICNLNGTYTQAKQYQVY